MKIKKTSGLIAIGLGLLLSSNLTYAQGVTVLNSNYESDTIPLSPGYTTFISGWVNSGYGDIGVEIPVDGGVDYTGTNNQGQSAYIEAGGRISQTVPTTVLKDEIYTLTYDVGRPLGQTAHSFAARFKANGLVLAQTQTSASGITAGTWSTQTLTFTATSDMPLDKSLVVEFYNLSSDAAGEVNIDNVSVSIAGTGVATPIAEQPEVIESVVIQSATLNVPEDFANINLALNFLNTKVIDQDSIITIQVNNCYSTTYTQPIEITHPQGDKIHILGDVDYLDDCPLRFTDSNGIVVSNKTGLGLIDGFHIWGSDTADTLGISATNSGRVNVGENVKVSDFSTGLWAKEEGVIYANKITSYSHLKNGFVSSVGGYLEADNSESYSNSNNGFLSNYGGNLQTQYSDSYYNALYGYYSTYSGYINGEYGDARSNSRQGWMAYQYGMINAPNSRATSNYYQGYYTTYSSQINQAGSYVSYNHRSYNSSYQRYNNYYSLMR